MNEKYEPDAEDFLKAAMDYAARGWPVIPLHPINRKGYCSCGMARDCGSPGKHPKTKNGLKDATVDIEQIKNWWPKESPLPSNIGVVTGGKGRLVVIDIDGEEGFEALGVERVKDLKNESVPCVRTGRGFHYYFKSETPIKTKPGFMNKVDIKAEGGYVVAPPSLHAVGRRYEQINIISNSLPNIPSWMLNGRDVSGKVPAINAISTTAIGAACIPKGLRNNTLFKNACSLKRQAVPQDTALETLSTINTIKCDPPLPEHELKNLLASAYKYEYPTFNCTDLGNAKRLVSQHGHIIRYCFFWKKWLIWGGKSWQIDNNGLILRLAKDTVKHIYLDASVVTDQDQREAIAKWAIKSEEEKRLKSMVSLAQSEPGVPISPDQLDTNHYLLSCLNGTIDLRTGQLKPHDPQDLTTKVIPVEYIPDAARLQWIEFLETIFNRNYDLINFIQRAVGYSLTGDISEQCLFLLHGTGANGKSVFIKTISHLLSDYAQTADFETFLVKKNDGGIRNDIARMQGKRFVSAIEAESGKRLSENLIKSLTGGDTISARFLFAEFFDFQPTFKLWLAANHKPNIRGTDYAIWRRIRLIPFNVTIPEDKQDRHLEEKLKAELSGILAWAVQGCLEWQKNGLQTPKEVTTATTGYRAEMDVIGDFISECCVLIPDAKVQAGKLYEAYKNWCNENGEFTLNQRAFGMKLSERGFERIESSGHWRTGIGLREK